VDDLENSEKYCPVCNNKNDRKALVCIHCGAALEEGSQGPTVTALSPEASMEGSVLEARVPIDEELIPVDGIAIHVVGIDKSVYVRVANQLVFGRKVKETDESLLDLTELGGFQMGISRRHAMIRRAGSGYEIIDLSSTNGTWINNERLIPDKPYPLANGAQLRLGRMRLFLFHRPPNADQKP
jgi:hypothetical protein